MLALYWLVFVVAVWIKIYLHEVRISGWFAHDLGLKGYFLGALAGAATPFCSCTTVPIFVGMIESDVRLGYAVSFLIASPTLNPPAIILFGALFGWQLTGIYIGMCLLIAVLGGLLLSGEKWQKYLIEMFYVPDEGGRFSFKEVNRQYGQFLRALAPVIVLAAGIATWLNGWEPSLELLEFAGTHSVAAMPGAIGLGGVIYADIGMLIPIGRLLIDKGLDVGLIFGFMMAASGVGLPSILILTRIFKKELLGRYLATIFVLFTLAGWLVAWII